MKSSSQTVVPERRLSLGWRSRGAVAAAAVLLAAAVAIPLAGQELSRVAGDVRLDRGGGDTADVSRARSGPPIGRSVRVFPPRPANASGPPGARGKGAAPLVRLP